MNQPKELYFTGDSPLAPPWRVFVEQQNKDFIKKVFIENGSQGALYNLLLTKLRLSLTKEGVTNFLTRSEKIGSLQDLVEGLEITVKLKETQK